MKIKKMPPISKAVDTIRGLKSLSSIKLPKTAPSKRAGITLTTIFAHKVRILLF